MLYPIRSSSDLNPAREQFIIAVNRRAVRQLPLPWHPGVKGFWMQWGTGPQLYALSGLHRDDKPGRDEGYGEMGIPDRKYAEWK